MLTRFKDRSSGLDGPVSGGLYTTSVQLATAIAAGETHLRVALQLPTGATLQIVNISSFTGAIGAAGATFSAGTTSGGQEIVANVAMTAGAMQHTIVSGAVAAGGKVYVQIVGGASTGTVALPVTITLTCFMSTPPTSLASRTVTGTGY